MEIAHSTLTSYGLVYFGLTCQSPQEEMPQLLLLLLPPVPSSCQVKINCANLHADVYSRGHTNMLHAFDVNISISVKHIVL